MRWRYGDVKGDGAFDRWPVVERDCFAGRGCFAGGNQVFMVYRFGDGARSDE